MSMLWSLQRKGDEHGQPDVVLVGQDEPARRRHAVFLREGRYLPAVAAHGGLPAPANSRNSRCLRHRRPFNEDEVA